MNCYEKTFITKQDLSTNQAKQLIEKYEALINQNSGKVVKIEYKGALKNTINDVHGGIRSSCSYVGAQSLKQISKCTTFIRVNRQYNNIYD